MELAVLVPVLARPENVGPLVASFYRGCPAGSELWFIVSTDDLEEVATVNAVLSDRVRVLWLSPRNGVSWPAKINAGVRAVPATWYLCAADDVTFGDGWWEATGYYRSRPEIGVIGTNDCYPGQVGNPGVAAHAHTCHPLMRHNYITEHGTVDEPGVAVHGGYHHWYVDNELVVTAKLRNAWAFCEQAVLVHNHPYWQRGTWDETYTAGEAHITEDTALWTDRATRLLGLTL